MAKKPKNRVKTKEVTENLKCMLTEEEIRQAGETTARLIQTKASLEKDKKSVVASFKAKIEAAEAGIIDQSNKVRDKYEYRDILCVERHDFINGTIVVHRTDIDKIIESKKMTLAEKNREELFDK